jgi:microcystin-dependent protein
MKLINKIASVAAVSISAALVTVPAQACGTTDTVYIGSICATAATFCPRDYAEANGAMLAISSHTTLFSLIGTNYGGDGRVSFGLPDLRGRSAIGVGTSPGLSPIAQGQRRGTEFVTQTILQMPSHTHTATSTGGSVDVTLSAKTVSGDNTPVEGAMLGAGGTGPRAADIYVAPGTAGGEVTLGGVAVTGAQGTITVGNSGASQETPNMPPQLGVRYCIAMQGIYPPRP